MHIQVKLDAAHTEAALQGLLTAMRDTSPLTKQVAQVLEDASNRAFEEERDPVTGAKWVKLNPDYHAQRVAEGHTGGMLQVSGGLATNRHKEYGHLYARFGSNHPFAAIHCFGGITRAHWIRPRDKKALAWRKGGRKMVRRAVFHPGSEIPRRRFLGLGPQDKRDIEEDIARYLREALGTR